MPNPDVKKQADTPSAASTAEISSARRFIVPVPYTEADLMPVVQRLWELANARGAHVTFLGLCQDQAQELSLRRKLATVTALMNSGKVTADSQVIVGKDVVAAVRSRWQTGDLVVCFDEPQQGLRRPLRQILKSDLKVPLYILTDVYPRERSRSDWKTQAAAWAGSLVIIAGFFVFQARVDLLVNSWATALQLLSLPAEVWLILAWNSLLG